MMYNYLQKNSKKNFLGTLKIKYWSDQTEWGGDYYPMFM